MSNKTVALNGCESALVVAALFALSEWPFANEGARVLASQVRKTVSQRTSEAVSSRWVRILEGAGLWSAGLPWTPELMARRAALDPALVLDPTELPLAIIALDVVAEEFSSDWEEFCTVVPGGIQWYPLEPRDVIALALRLKRGDSE